MTKNNETKAKVKRIFILLFSLFIILNIGIVVSGKTYLYKGVQSTYLKGKMGPGIYDSLIFSVRIAEKSKGSTPWLTSQNVPLNEQALALFKQTKTTSFLVVKDGAIVHESYYEKHGIKTKSNSFSMAKSVIGLLIGIAVDEGKINSFDDPITRYLPFSIEGDESITIRQLLGMASGLNWSESGINPFSDNAEAYYTSNLFDLIKRQSFAPTDDAFAYKSGNSQILGILLEQATGMSPTEYFAEKVWRKIGAEDDFLWSLDREDGEEKTFCCGYATTRDYARLGQLILNNGRWNNQQIIQEATLAEITHAYNAETSWYGLHFWLVPHPAHPMVYFRGILGQYIVVVPSLNAVMVRTGHLRKGNFANTDGKTEKLELPEKYQYKENHPIDLFDYFAILQEVLKQVGEP